VETVSSFTQEISGSWVKDLGLNFATLLVLVIEKWRFENGELIDLSRGMLQRRAVTTCEWTLVAYERGIFYQK
jgi:hypothetical protein